MSFDPSGMAGLQIWLDASRLGLILGQDVRQFTDFSGKGQHGILYGSPPPTIANGPNGLPVVHITGLPATGGRFWWPTTGVDKDYTLVYVGRCWDTASQGRLVTTNTDFNNFLLGYWGGNEDAFFAGNWLTGALGVEVKKAQTTNWKLYSFDAASTPSYTPRFFSNGLLMGSIAMTTSFGGVMSVSGHTLYGTYETISSEVAELLMFSRKLSDLERQQVETYLRSKWLATTAPTLPLTSLTDAFSSDIDRIDKWSASTGAPNVYWDSTNQRVGIVCSPSFYSLKTPLSPLRYNLINSSVYAKVTPSTPAAGKEFDFYLQNADQSVILGWLVYGTNLIAWSKPGPTNNYAQVPYDPVAHQWLRFRADNTTVYWDTSSDGLQWRLFASAPWAALAPGMGRSSNNVGWSYPTYLRIQGTYAWDFLALPVVMSDMAAANGLALPAWTASGATTADSGTGGMYVAHNYTSTTNFNFPPGWSNFQFPSGVTNTAPQNWVATDGTNTAFRCTVATGPTTLYVIGGTATYPAGTILAAFKNGVEFCRMNVVTTTTNVALRTDTSFAVNDVLELRLYNPDPANNLVMGYTNQAGPNTKRPSMQLGGREAETAGDQWVCPTTGIYDIHLETCAGSAVIYYSILVNRVQVAHVQPGAYQSGTDTYTVYTCDARGVSLNAGDRVGIGLVSYNYSSPQPFVNRIEGGEGVARPWLRISLSSTPGPVIATDAWLVNFSQGGPVGQADAFVDHVNVPPVDNTYGYGAYGDGPYGSPIPIWEPIQGPAGPPGDSDLALRGLISGRMNYNSGWNDYPGFADGTVYRDRQGVCYLNTTVIGPTSFAAGTVIGYMPPLMVPGNRVMHPGYVGNPAACCRIDIGQDGSISVQSTTPAGVSYCILDLVWYSFVPQWMVLDGFWPITVVSSPPDYYQATWSAGRLINQAGRIVSIPAGTIQAGSTQFTAGRYGFVAVYPNGVGIVAAAAGYTNEGWAVNGFAGSYLNSAALLCTFMQGPAGSRAVYERRLTAYA